VLSIQKRSKFVLKKNEHVRYTLEYFPVGNACYLPENIPMYTAPVHFFMNFDLFCIDNTVLFLYVGFVSCRNCEYVGMWFKKVGSCLNMCEQFASHLICLYTSAFVRHWPEIWEQNLLFFL
jgi:hypothetical protein